MSYDEHLREQKRGKAKQRSTLGARLAASRETKKTTARADWGDAHPDNVTALLLTVTRFGGALSLGTSRDRGAFNITVFLDGERATTWVGADESVDDALITLVHELEELAAGQ